MAPTRTLGHFATILNWGKAGGHLPECLPNPAAAALRKNRRAARGRMLSFAQLTALGRELTRDEPRSWQARQALRLILLTGCRRGEILSLKWSDVKRTKLALRDAKSGARDVSLSAEAREVITDLKRRTGNHAFVFPSGCTASGRTESLDGTWTRLKHRAGLPADIRIHDLRHTYASHAILAGESLPMTGRLLGHRSAHSTKRYAHLDGTTLSQAADKLARQIDKLMAG